MVSRIEELQAAAPLFVLFSFFFAHISDPKVARFCNQTDGINC